MQDFNGPGFSKLDCALLMSSFALGVAIVFGTYYSDNTPSGKASVLSGKGASLSLMASSLLDSD